MKYLNAGEMWSFLIDNEIATENELQLVTSLNGFSEKTLLDVLYIRTGYRTFEQLEDSWNDFDY